jgi:hypothetical protein
MDEKQLQALANELAKNLKTPDDLNQFDRLLKKISVEAALNAEMSHHLGYDKNQPKLGLIPVTAISQRPLPPAMALWNYVPHAIVMAPSNPNW